MKIYRHPNEIESVPFGATIGNFDGIHLGHRAMLDLVKRQCQVRGLEFAVITFLPHPLQILKAMRGFLLSGYQKRRELLQSVGVQHLVELPFTKEFSGTPASKFITEHVLQVNNFKMLSLGFDFAFGSNKEGDCDTVKALLQGSQVELVSLPEHRPVGKQVSSTVIRNLIREGKVDEIEELLGREFSLEGEVVKGKGRGKGIGFPTANIQVGEEMIIPSTGVYSTSTIIKDNCHRSVTNIGFNPTFSDTMHVSVETYILGIDEDFYGEQIEVFFHEKIREEKRFASVDDLKKQIAKDVTVAKQWKSKA